MIAFLWYLAREIYYSVGWIVLVVGSALTLWWCIFKVAGVL